MAQTGFNTMTQSHAGSPSTPAPSTGFNTAAQGYANPSTGPAPPTGFNTATQGYANPSTDPAPPTGFNASPSTTPVSSTTGNLGAQPRDLVVDLLNKIDGKTDSLLEPMTGARNRQADWKADMIIGVRDMGMEVKAVKMQMMNLGEKIGGLEEAIEKLYREWRGGVGQQANKPGSVTGS
ncbi:hypothetical protein GP486_005465, partial [Trichoglossum hirsutum]